MDAILGPEIGTKKNFLVAVKGAAKARGGTRQAINLYAARDEDGGVAARH